MDGVFFCLLAATRYCHSGTKRPYSLDNDGIDNPFEVRGLTSELGAHPLAHSDRGPHRHYIIIIMSASDQRAQPQVPDDDEPDEW